MNGINIITNIVKHIHKADTLSKTNETNKPNTLNIFSILLTFGLGVRVMVIEVIPSNVLLHVQ